MLCVIKEIYTVYTSFICICVFYSLKIVVHLNIYVSNPQVSTAFEGTSLGSFPTCRGSPTKKYKMLIPHPSPVLMHSSDEFVGCESWRFTPLKCFSPRWEARYLFIGKSYVVKLPGKPNLTWKCWDGNSGSEKVGWSSYLQTPSLQHQGARFSFFASPINDGSLRFEPVGGETRGAKKQLWRECYKPYIDGLING